MRGFRRSKEFLDPGVLEPFSCLVAPESIRVVVGNLVGEHVSVIAEPESEAARLVELVVEPFALLRCVFLGIPLDVAVVEAAVGLLPNLVERGIHGLVPVLIRRVEPLLMHGKGKVGRALEDGKLGDVRGDLLNRLDTRGTCADHSDALPLDVDVLLGPRRRVAREPLEFVDALVAGDVRPGGKAGGNDQVLGDIAVSVSGLGVPHAAFIVPVGRLDESVEATWHPEARRQGQAQERRSDKENNDSRAVLGDVELLVDVFEVLYEFLLARKPLGPRPITPQLLEREFVDGNVRVDTSSGVAVCEPNAAQAARGIDDVDVESKLAEVIPVIDASESCADNDDVVLLLAHCCLLNKSGTIPIQRVEYQTHKTVGENV
jgi:hypothetical protein